MNDIPLQLYLAKLRCRASASHLGGGGGDGDGGGGGGNGLQARRAGRGVDRASGGCGSMALA